MAYHEEVFKTGEERNKRRDELKKTYAGVVTFSNPVKIGVDDSTGKTLYETVWGVAYPTESEPGVRNGNAVVSEHVQHGEETV